MRNNNKTLCPHILYYVGLITITFGCTVQHIQNTLPQPYYYPKIVPFQKWELYCQKLSLFFLDEHNNIPNNTLYYI